MDDDILLLSSLLISLSLLLLLLLLLTVDDDILLGCSGSLSTLSALLTGCSNGVGGLLANMDVGATGAATAKVSIGDVDG